MVAKFNSARNVLKKGGFSFFRALSSTFGFKQSKKCQYDIKSWQKFIIVGLRKLYAERIYKNIMNFYQKRRVRFICLYFELSEQSSRNGIWSSLL
jgi:hypothetical protein